MQHGKSVPFKFVQECEVDGSHQQTGPLCAPLIRGQGVDITPDILILADNATLILPLHRDLDGALACTRRHLLHVQRNLLGA